jgi:TatD DNase family protein
VVAIGEIGLDFYRNLSPREIQFQALRWQLVLAEKAGLPVIIHTRQAEADILRELEDWSAGYQLPPGQARGVIHCFSESLATAQHCLAMGFYIAFGGYVGYPSSRRLYDIIKAIPDDRIVVETDCPFLPPQPYRGQRNEPSYLPITLSVLAGIRGVTAEKMAEETTRNAQRLFRL